MFIKKNWSVLSLKLAFQKMDFPLYFQQLIRVGEGTVFFANFFHKKAEHAGICPSFGGNMGKT